MTAEAAYIPSVVRPPAPRSRKALRALPLAALAALAPAGPHAASLETPRVVVLPERADHDARTATLRALSAPSVRVLGALGPDALLVRLPDEAALRVLPASARVRGLLPSDKLAPGSSDDTPLVVHPLPGTPPEELLRALARPEGEGWEAHSRFLVVRRPPPGLAAWLARRDDTLAVVPLPEARPAGAESWGLVQSGLVATEPFFRLGIAGQAEILAVADSGLTIDCYFEDPGQPVATEVVDPGNPPASPVTNPSHRKVHAYQAHVASDFDDEQSMSPPNHGSNVAGVAAADESPHADPSPGVAGAWPVDVRAGLADGHAPAARLVVQDLASGPGYLVPSDLAGFVRAAYNAGARTWNASWTTSLSAADFGAYDHFARELDVASDATPELVVTVAAGNNGPGPSTVEPPSTAKSVLSVGNSRTGTRVEDVHVASAHGPTADGRIKPDLVAPGSNVLCARGDVTQPCVSAALIGTSLAAPAAAAAAVLTRQYLREGREGSGQAGSALARRPSSALVRAVLAASTRSLRGGPDGGNVEQPAPSPEQGWGRIVLADALPLPGSALSLVVHADDDVTSPADGFPTGASSPATFTVTVIGSELPLVVALAFTDEPPLPAAPAPTVNDLDLEVLSPSGDLYLGNRFSGGVSVTGGVADAVNTIELVRVPAPEAGDWTLRVRPSSVVVGPQPHALISTGRTCRPVGPFSLAPVAAEVACGEVAVAAPAAGGSPPVTYSLFRAPTPGGYDFGTPLASGLLRPAVLDTLAPGATAYYVFRADDACGASALSSEATVTASSPCDLGPTIRVTKPQPSLVRLDWGDTLARAVRRHPAPAFVRGASVVATSSTGSHEEPMPSGRLACWVVD